MKMDKREKLKLLVNQVTLSDSQEEVIYNAFGYETHECRGFDIFDSDDNYVGNSADTMLPDILGSVVNRLDEEQIEEIYEKLEYDFDLEEGK